MSIKTILVTGGRAPFALELVRHFAQMGYRVLGAESCRQNISRRSKYLTKNYQVAPPRQNFSGFINDLVEICRQENVDHLIPTCEEVFYISQGKDQFEHLQTTVFVDDIDKLRQLHNKVLFNQLTLDTKFPGPPTKVVKSLEDVQKHRSCNKIQVLKPVYSRFSSQVHILGQNDKLPVHCSISPSLPWALQDFVAGREICFYGIARKGQLQQSVCYENAFRAGKGAGICFQPVKRPSLVQWAEEIIQSLNYTGQIAFDVIETRSGEFVPIECNPRSTSGIHLLVQGEGLKSLIEPSLAPVSSAFPAQIAFAMVFFGLPRLRSFRDFQSWCHCFTSYRDVLMDRSDWAPAWGQVSYLLSTIQLGLQKNRSLLEATTYDIQWDGEPFL